MSDIPKEPDYTVYLDMHEGETSTIGMFTVEIVPPLGPEADLEELLRPRFIGSLVTFKRASVHYLPLNTIADVYYDNPSNRDIGDIREDVSNALMLSLSPSQEFLVEVKEVFASGE